MNFPIEIGRTGCTLIGWRACSTKQGCGRNCDRQNPLFGRPGQGNRLKISSHASQDGMEIIRVPSGDLAAYLEALAGFGRAQEIHRHVPDGGHVVRAMTGAQTREVLMEGDIQYPMQAVLDVPVAAY